jgi:ATP/maltotriose-dependent transcriptional regulator MalT
VNLVARAVSLLPADDPSRVDLLPNVRAVQGVGELEWVDHVLTEAVEAAATSGDRRLAANALVQRGFLRLFSGDDMKSSELLDVAERSIRVFEELDDHAALARAWRLVAQAQYLDRNLALCAASSERAYSHVVRVHDPYEEDEIVEWLLISHLLGPTYAGDAADRCERLLDETQKPSVRTRAFALATMAPLVLMQGEVARADELIAEARATMESAAETIWITRYWFSLGRLWRNQPDLAEAELRPGYDALRTMGERSHLSSLSHALANAVYMQRRYDEAEFLARECERVSRANDALSQIMWRSTLAKILARRGDHEAAERLGQEALALASDGDLYFGRAESHMDMAEIATLRSDTAAANAHLDHAIGDYRNKGNDFAADGAAERLRVLTADARS